MNLRDFYVLDIETSTWTEKEWLYSPTDYLYAMNVWTIDGETYFYSGGFGQYVLGY